MPMLKPIRTTLSTLVLGLTVGGAALADAPLSAEEARHLAARTGFGASPAEIQTYSGMTRTEAVDQILAGITTTASTPMPEWTDGWLYPHDQVWSLGQTAQELFFANRWLEVSDLQQWWLAEMVATPTPLTERLVLFWHDHFATSFDGTENAQWMANQNKLFRAHAAGDFAKLASAILRDPAMLVYLTNTENSKDAPNENLAREYFELFTLGEGRGYNEQDVQEAARALTGHTVEDLAAPLYVFDAEVHDPGRKTIFGQTDRFDAPDLAILALDNPAFGSFIVEKLWLEFVSDQPDPAEVARLADLWRASDWMLEPVLRELFLSDAFWDPANRGRLIKGPVDLLVGTTRSLGLDLPELTALNWASGEMGQSLFFPPNVGGWPGGTAWINDANAAMRSSMLLWMLDWEAEAENEGTPSMMMTEASYQPTITEVAPGDLRVGEVFVPYAFYDREEDHTNGLITLYDVSFGDHTWRSISMWIESAAEEEVPYVSIQTKDCSPTCFKGWADFEEEPGWILFNPWETRELNRLKRQQPETHALAAAVLGHLPDALEQTEDRRFWTDPGEGEERATYRQFEKALRRVSKTSARVLDPTPGNFVFASSPQGDFGLGTVDYTRLDEDELADMVEAREEAYVRPATPVVTYSNADEWLAALPPADLASRRAEAALLAVPLPDEGRRDEMFAEDVLALVRRIILSPQYQVK